MGRSRKPRPPVEVHTDRLDARHTSGLDDEGRRWSIRGAPIGATVLARPGRRDTARRLDIVTPAPDALPPTCPAFGACGGCQLQEMPLDHQRRAKQDLVSRLVGPAPRVHDIVGAPQAYGYRNKLELSFGTRRWWPEGTERDEAEGSFLGFHPPGWFSKIVPLTGCPLGTPAMNAAIAAVVEAAPGPAWNNHDHTGTWRHLVVRDAGDGRALVTFVTSSAATEDQVRAVAERIPDPRGVLWVVTDRLSDVADGELRAVLRGTADLEFDLGPARMVLPHDAFFQVNTPGARLLFDIVGEALGEGGDLMDLYCGVGAIGLYLAHRHDRITGIELHEGAIECARDNAARNGIAGEWHAGRVEALLPTLSPPDKIVVDPPRAGLHPEAARFLAEQPAKVLVYVACKPASLAHDRAILEAGGWRMTDLWSVDLFPQTHHVEAVARFARDGASE